MALLDCDGWRNQNWKLWVFFSIVFASQLICCSHSSLCVLWFHSAMTWSGHCVEQWWFGANVSAKGIQGWVILAAKQQRYWGNGNNAISVETTAYALLQTLLLEDMEYASLIATWLTERRNYGGGFCSTQVPDHQFRGSLKGRGGNKSTLKTLSFRFESIITVHFHLLWCMKQ